MQVTILKLLCGKQRSKVFQSIGPKASTPEITEELIELGMVNYDRPRKQKTFTVRRSMVGLFDRGYVTGVYRKGDGADEEPMPFWGDCIVWTATDAAYEYLKKKENGPLTGIDSSEKR